MLVKDLTDTDQKRIKTLDRKINQARKFISLYVSELNDLKKQKAKILCPFKIGQEVIRDDGLRGKVSKIVFDGQLQRPVISVFTQTKKRREFKYNTGEHYRTKENEQWDLFNADSH